MKVLCVSVCASSEVGMFLFDFVEKGSVADLWNTKVKLTKENPCIFMTLHLNGSVAHL